MDPIYQKSLKKGIDSLNEWVSSFGTWAPDETLQVPDHRADEVFNRLAERLQCNFPFEHPVYAGQMLKPPHPLAWAAYAMAIPLTLIIMLSMAAHPLQKWRKKPWQSSLVFLDMVRPILVT